MAARDLRMWGQRLEGSFLGRCVSAFVALQGLDRAMVIASQAFTALIPLLILLSAVLPTEGGADVADAIVGKFELTGDAARSVETVFASSTEAGSVGVVSLLLLVFSGVTLTRRLQRLYQQAWQLPPLLGVRGSLRAAMGLAVLLVEIALFSMIRGLVRALPFEWLLGVPLSVLANVVLWTSIPWLLLDRRVEWRRLIPAGVLAGLSAALYGFATTIYMPRLMESYSQRYGLFGVTVSLVGWLLCISFIVVATTVVAAELDRAPQTWARRLRARLGITPEGPTQTPSRASSLDRPTCD